MYAAADAMHCFAEAIADLDVAPAHACCPDWSRARHAIGSEAAAPELVNQALQHALWSGVQRAAQSVRHPCVRVGSKASGVTHAV